MTEFVCQHSVLCSIALHLVNYLTDRLQGVLVNHVNVYALSHRTVAASVSVCQCATPTDDDRLTLVPRPSFLPAAAALYECVNHLCLSRL